MRLVSDKLVCGWNYPGILLDEIRKTTKLRIMSRRSAYVVNPVTNEFQQVTITAARQSQTCPLLQPCAQGYRPKSNCSLPQTNTTAFRYRLTPPYHYTAGWTPEESRFDCRQGHDISTTSRSISLLFPRHKTAWA
jgi:hypothetical protein